MRYNINTITKTNTYMGGAGWDEEITDTHTLTHDIEGGHHILTQDDRYEARVTNPGAAMSIIDIWANDSEISINAAECIYNDKEAERVSKMISELSESRDYGDYKGSVLVIDGLEHPGSVAELLAKGSGIYYADDTIYAATVYSTSWTLAPISDYLDDEELAAEMHQELAAHIRNS